MHDSLHALILTNPEDYHAFVISECLERKSIPYSLWHAVDFPSLQAASVWLDSSRERWSINGPEISFPFRSRISAVWLRRPGRPVIPEHLDPGDRLFAYRECWTFFSGLQRLVGADAFWVNSPAGFARSNLKVEQLRSAARNGFQIPETLLSNEPTEIRSFIQSRPGKVIYKAFFPFAWKSAEGQATLFCSIVSLGDLPEDPVLAAVPGIYQALVEKDYEVRVTAMGRRLFAVKIYSQESPSARMDWRAATEQVRLEPFTLPKPVQKACRAVMRDLGIVFGCFDLIVTPAGDYVFLEVNEAGAFLWLEEQLPEILLADAFCEFLFQGLPELRTSAKRPRVKLADIHHAALRRMKESAPLHAHEPAETLAESSGT
jgi:hypothetical protein